MLNVSNETEGILNIIETVQNARRGSRWNRPNLAQVFSSVKSEVDSMIAIATHNAILEERERVRQLVQVQGIDALRTFNSPAIISHVNAGNKLMAIKLLRDATSAGLKVAKDEIERRMSEEPTKYGYITY